MSGGVAQVTGAIPSPRAVTACAHKLARLIYTMVTKGEEYVDQGPSPQRGALPGEGRQIIVQESLATRLPTLPHARNGLKRAL